MTPPTTETDHFILAEASKCLVAGEQIVTWAYLVPIVSRGGGGLGSAAQSFANAATMSAAFAVVTDRRLVLIHTRIGAFKPLLENIGVVAIERSAIRGAAVGKTLAFELADGQLIEFQVKRSSTHVSAQAAFFAQGAGRRSSTPRSVSRSPSPTC
jgi:hypothetical protein